ncbi:membrane fusion protein (multidrug efflux system) [Rhodoblastus acidophilus]|uniref:efflux RND transporter periplasmic adaptor subunit n=1 Tax=Rhodoblastus acidophilus TaxID=1074 RepID=UPI0022241BE7|nr:efflux RND transporter periplasmic adaptor subunit [Rhodoblastus acidophilus]MCW2285031.1 membrane fusion protein (multidrug efflux system) [Rhodoblastus acidophilus]MCW2333905.1 membrane fusion protein (multidrug efflux system) [Rhodoblastus acidophilus]
MRVRSFLLTLVILSAVVGGLAYFQFMVKPSMVAGFMAKMPRPVSGVSVEAARSETWTPRLAAIGSFKAVPGIDVAGQLAGIIAEVAVKNGQDVPQGALLFRIDDAIEQAELKSNAATLKNAEVAYQRQQSLLARGVAAQANLDAAIAARDTAAAAVERAKVIIAQKTIQAPFAGRIGIRKVDVGQYVAAGAALVSLQQLDPIYIDFPAAEQFFSDLAIGQTVTAQVDLLGGLKVSGKIVNLDARVDRETRTLLVRAEMSNPDKKVLPGMFGNVEVEAGKPHEVVSVPRTAIAYSLYGDSVYVVVPQDEQKGFDGPLRAERRFVRLGDTRDERVAIAEGVKAGEKVVTQGQIKLQPNMPVTIEANSGLPPQKPLPLQ